MRALGVVKCQFAVAWLALRSCSQAAISSMRVCLSGIRWSRHWDDRTPSSDSARSSQLPCFGARLHSVSPGAFDQRASGMGVAGIGDATASDRLAARLFARNQAEIGHELAWVRKACEVAD